MSAKSWVQTREGYLTALSKLYVSDWRTFSHILKMTESDMKSRAPKGQTQTQNLLGAAIQEKYVPENQAALQKIYAKALSDGEAVCTTFAYSTAYVLAQPDQPTVEVVSHMARKRHAGTHVFVVVGRDQRVEITNPAWIRGDCIIVDTWAKALGWQQISYTADTFAVSPVQEETDRLRLLLNATSIAEGPPVLVGGSATGSKQKSHRRCYITTATCASLGLGDDCEELTVLRDFRDRVLLASADGRRDVEQYYAEAPAIVGRIDARPDRDRIYAALYANAIGPAVAAVQAGDYARAHAIFRDLLASADRWT